MSLQTKPDKLPVWATSGSAAITEPNTAKKELGWIDEEAPPHTYFNWLQNKFYEWIKYLEQKHFGKIWNKTPFIANNGKTRNAITKDANGYYYIASDDGYILVLDEDYNYYDLLLPSVDIPTTEDILDITYGDGYLVGVCYNGDTIYSSNGSSWSAGGSASSHLYAVAENGGMFVAVGYGGIIYTSTDHGVNWTSRTSGTGNSFYDVVWDKNFDKWFATYNGGVRSSSDGITWGATTSYDGATPVTPTYKSIATSGTVLLAGTLAGEIFESVNGTEFYLQNTSNDASFDFDVLEYSQSDELFYAADEEFGYLLTLYKYTSGADMYVAQKYTLEESPDGNEFIGCSDILTAEDKILALGTAAHIYYTP